MANGKSAAEQAESAISALTRGGSVASRAAQLLSDSPFSGSGYAALDLTQMRFPATELADYTLMAASKTIRLLERQIREIEAGLDETHAIAFWIVGGPAGQTFMPQQISAENPDKIIFKGIDVDHQPFVLVQHVTQLNLAIRVAPLEKGEERLPIGFHIPTSE